MFWGKGETRLVCVALAAALLGGAVKGAVALPHDLIATPRRTDALTLALYVKSSMGEAYFVAIPSSIKVLAASVTADDVVEPSRHGVLSVHMSSRGSFAVRAGERSVHVISGLNDGAAYDVYFVTEAANSNGLFSSVGKILGVPTNGAAPLISRLTAQPVDARTNATEISFSMDAPGVSCRVWYTVLPLRDTVLLSIEAFSAEGISEAAKPASVVALPQGLKGERSPPIVHDGLDDDTWYQVSAVAERTEGVFSKPVFTIVRTHRDPAGILETAVKPLQGSTDSLALLVRLDCSASPTGEACGLLSYRVSEKPPRGSPEHVKPRQVSQGKVMIMDGRAMAHHATGLTPGKAHLVAMMVESPGSNGAFGPAVEAEATTFPLAPRLLSIEVSRSDTAPSVVTVRYKLSEPGIVHVRLAEQLGHPLAMQAAMVGNQHGVSFFREVGIGIAGIGGDDEHEGQEETLEGFQELHGLAAGSAFDLTAHTESVLLKHPSGVFGKPTSRVIEAVPPSVVNVRASALDATTTEILFEYEVRGTAGRLHYALMEKTEAGKGGKDSVAQSAAAVMSAVTGQSGVITAGSTPISPSEDRRSHSYGDEQMSEKIRFRGLTPTGQYVVCVCTEGNSGRVSAVVTATAEAHAEAPVVADATATPADRLSGALSLAVSLESAGLVHFIMRRRTPPDGSSMSYDHTIVHKGKLDLHGAISSSKGSGGAGGGAGGGARGPVAVVETVEGLEPNVTYEIFLVTETANSNGVYRSEAEPLLATTHPIPPSLLDARAHAADATSSALTVTVSLESPAELHYAVFPATSVAIRPGDHKEGDPTLLEGVPSHGQHRDTEDGARADVIVGEYNSDGCANASISGRGPLALNRTVGLVTSGVVPASVNASLSSNGNRMTTTPGAAIVWGGGGSSAQREVALGSHSNIPIAPLATSVRRSRGDAHEVVFRVEGLQAAGAYDMCLFTEMPGSNGLFGVVHALRGVTTHAPVPELASERVACTLDCRGLNRDPCWLEANKCGECLEGFVGKAGHVNSPCGKVSLLTEADIAQIAERERRERDNSQQFEHGGNTGESSLLPHDAPAAGALSEGKKNIVASQVVRFDRVAPDGGDLDHLRVNSWVTALGAGTIDDGARGAASKLLGVPVALGPNVTRFLYVDVPEEGGGEFDPQTIALKLCLELHGGTEETGGCAASLALDLGSRLTNGHFHEAESDRPVLQVEMEAPEGESLAFVLKHGEEAGKAAVGFCRENKKALPDEQTCVITLMREMSSWR